MKKKLSILLLAFIPLIGFAATDFDSTSKSREYIQFTGIVITSDSIIPIPFVHVTVKNKPYGDYSDFSGKFSFVAEKGDTVWFSHVQFRNSFYVIPDTLTDFKYHMIQAMTMDTIFLDGAIVTPVPNRNTFDQFFLTADIPLDKMDIAKRNLDRESLKDQALYMGMDEKENYQAYVKYQTQMQYHRNMAPSITLMNPFAWAQFFESWSRGDFKRNPNQPRSTPSSTPTPPPAQTTPLPPTTDSDDEDGS